MIDQLTREAGDRGQGVAEPFIDVPPEIPA
jgi:hypothetical protein